MYNYKAKVKRIVDGDTVDLEIELGFKIKTEVRCRLLNVDTPERGHEDFKRASQLLEDAIVNAKDKDGFIIVNTHKTGKYGRWLVDIPSVNPVMAARWPYKT